MSVGVLVGVTVGVFVGVLGGVSVGVLVGVTVGVLVAVFVSIAVSTGVLVGVSVGIPVSITYSSSQDCTLTNCVPSTTTSTLPLSELKPGDPESSNGSGVPLWCPIHVAPPANALPCSCAASSSQLLNCKMLVQKPPLIPNIPTEPPVVTSERYAAKAASGVSSNPLNVSRR